MSLSNDAIEAGKNAAGSEKAAIPSINLPKGGGAISGIGEKFAANPVTGTASMSVPIATSPGRSGFGPQLALSYDSGTGNGPFGFGWSLSLPSITRKTDKGLPRYMDGQDQGPDSDIFILSGSEDLVPVYRKDASGSWVVDLKGNLVIDDVEIDGYRVRRYCPRVEGLFARIERWSSIVDPSEVYWRSISKENLLTLYGKDENSRVVDPADHRRIFSWLICETRDDKGNAIVYKYKPEDGTGVDFVSAHERNRGEQEDTRRTSNRYLKRILYGNRTPVFLDGAGHRPRFLTEEQMQTAGWMFEVVFDYGEHDSGTPQPSDDPAMSNSRPWPARNDPFSSYRAGFEVRTYRLCKRVLMYHHISDLPTGENGYDGLVRSTDFSYSQDKDPQNASNPVYSFLLSVSQSGYKRVDAGGYISKSLPPVEFEYTQPIVQESVQDVDVASLENLPIGVDGTIYQWTDLHGEGIPGILTEQAGAWFYKRNISPISERTVEFAAQELVAVKPNLDLVGTQFMDLGGDGQTDLVVLQGPVPGFYEHDEDVGWQSFRPFTSRLNHDMRDPNLKLIDLDGDGHADVLISEDEAFIWHASLAEEGFGPARLVAQALDEEKGPRLVFSDISQSIYLADLSGDGLIDLVRIRNGEVCYWPNLGYCRFGAKVSMDHAPVFDNSDLFDQKRLRLADIDGSGTVDIIYLHRDGVRLYFNQSGNSWSEAQALPVCPHVDDLVSIVATDLLGNSTACLVWSSPLPGDGRRQMRYVDLMGGQKPHLLIKTVNNLGAEIRVQYAPSTKFYLQDKQKGKPWITKLPFPVHVVERVTVTDMWRKTTFTTTYSYHHGYFDGIEREFRGFGRVEQVDVEDFDTFAAGNAGSPYITDDKRLYQPPVKTVTWFHTGAFLDREGILSHFKGEYFPNWFKDAHPGAINIPPNFQENDLPEPDLEAFDLSAGEWREALRSCKGLMLRQELYELDVGALAGSTHKPVKLFSATYHNCHIHRVQLQDTNQHAVFHVTESEAITYQYELDLRPDKLTPDPRIKHTLNLRIDEYGNIQQSATAVYPRLGRYVDSTLKDDEQDLIQQVQSELHLAYTETQYTNDVNDVSGPDNYRLRLPCEVQSCELTGITPRSHAFTLDELRAYKLSDKYQISGTPVAAIAYHVLPSHTLPQKRIVEHARFLFFDTSLDKPLMLGSLNALGLPFESYKLALSDEILHLVFKDKLTMPVMTALSEKQTSGYLSGGDLAAGFAANTAGQYWICAGVAGFSPDAALHFYLPERYTDPFGNVTTLVFDPYDLYVQSSTDAMNNRTEVIGFDFRVLAPLQMKDANNNLSEVRFDILGMPAAMALMGKGDEADSLNAFDDVLLNPELATKQAFFVDKPYNAADAKDLLGSATARHLYYFGEVIQDGKTVWGQHPACACDIVRERHAADEPSSPVQCAFGYSDGSGNMLVKKVQAEPELGSTTLRWVASGKIILNNKGKPVKQYEPYFSPALVGHRFEEPAEIGVTPVIYYDAGERVVRSESPDGSYSRVEFSPWHVRTFDQNDTVTEEGNGWFARMSAPAASAEDRRTARLAAEHADTPSVTVLDSLGRQVVAIAHNRVGPATAMVDEKYVTFTRFDAEGKPLWTQDSRGNRVMQYIMPPLPDGVHPLNDASNLKPQGFAPCYDIAGNLLFQHSMDAGDRWMLNDAAGKPMFAWNSRMFITRVVYDKLQRPTGSFVTGADPAHPAPEIQFFKLIYGEGQVDDRQRNLRGKPYKHFDTAGVVTSEAYDFKGNPLSTTRQQTVDYKITPDWSQNRLLEDEQFVSGARYDALNRPIQIIAPHSLTMNPQRINVTQPEYNEAGLLEGVHVWLNQSAKPATLLESATASQHVVKNINYDAKGQRVLLQYGNGSETSYDYQPDTYRLKQLKTTRNIDNATLQDLSYTYDPVGNITRIGDEAQDRTFHSNQCVLPGAEYRYDPLYRLIAASGREHKGDGLQYGWDDSSHSVPTLPNDCQALQNYVEKYRYDAVGNIMQMVHHIGRNLEQPGQVLWNRRYQYAVDSNRLLATSLPGDPVNLPEYVAMPSFSDQYGYDVHGNITVMPHLPTMRWNFQDQLSAAATQVMNNGTPETTYYVYDGSGQRVRKVTETQTGIRRKQRLYLGGFEVYREYSGGAVALERESLHVMDDKQRVSLIETQTIKAETQIVVTQPLVRYQLGNHLGSASLELDESAAVITYEEYTPYGSSAYCAGRSAAEVSLKRYRYTGKERDDETGFTYHGARYYAPWLGRWVSSDPCDDVDSTNSYAYVTGSPIVLHDPTGHKGQPPTGGITISPQSKITAQQFVDMIQRSEKIPNWMKQVFSAQGNRILVKSQFQLPPNVTQADIPKWFFSAALAIKSGDWHITTGASNVSKESLRPNEKLQGDFERGDEPTGGPKTTGIMMGETIESQQSGARIGLRSVTDQNAGGETNPSLRRPTSDKKSAEGLIIVANRFRSPLDPTKEVGRSDDAILETLFHELAGHAGQISQGLSSDHGIGGDWLNTPITETDELAKAVHEFFSNPSEQPIVKKLTPNVWERAKKAGTPSLPSSTAKPKDNIWEKAKKVGRTQ